MTMVLWNRNAIVAIAAMLSAGALFPNTGQARPPQAFTEMQGPQSRQAGILPSTGSSLLLAAAGRDDWTSWGGALRGSSALRHGDRTRGDQAKMHRRQRPDFEQS